MTAGESATQNVFAPPRANLESQEGPQELWQMDFKRLRRLYNASHTIRALGGLYGLGLVIFLGGALTLVNSRYSASPDNRALVVLMFAFSALSLLGAVTSFVRRRWARWLGMGLCVLSLASVPIGTVIGILGIIAYAQGGRLFGRDRVTHKDVVGVYQQRKRTKT